MMKRVLPLLLLLGFPVVAVGQAPPLTPQRGVTVEEELQRLITSRDALTKEIEQLRTATGRFQSVIVSVRVCELSLDKARNANIKVDGFDLKRLHEGGFAEALSAGLFDEPGHNGDVNRASCDSESCSTGVLEDDKTLNKVIDELVKAGALKIVAEPTLAFVTGRPASLHVGGKFPIPVPQPGGDTTVEYRTYGTELDVTASLLGAGRINLELRPRISEIDNTRSVVLGDLTVPGLRVREISTGVEMGDGHTLVVAGLVQTRVVHQPPEEPSNTANDKHPASAPSRTSEGNTVPNQDETETFEFIVMARPEIYRAP